jgi:hypothetical protein
MKLREFLVERRSMLGAGGFQFLEARLLVTF